MSKLLKVVPLTLKQANAFVTEHHRHNKRCVGCKFCLGAMYEDRLVGVVIVGRPVSRRLDTDLTLEINRNCVLDEAPKGTCSFLYAKAMKVWQSMGGKKIITYTLASEGGASLRAVNFKKAADTPAVPIHQKGWRTREKREHQSVQLELRLRWEKNLEA